MTEDEQNRLMGTTAAELAKVRKELTCLEAKADTFLGILSQASATIRDTLGDGGREETFSDSTVWPTIKQMDALCCEINEARNRRYHLTTRLREWGVIE